MDERNLSRIELRELDSEASDVQLDITSLEVFRPMGNQISDPQIVDAQRAGVFRSNSPMAATGI